MSKQQISVSTDEQAKAPRARQSISKDPGILEYFNRLSDTRRARLKMLVEQRANGSTLAFGKMTGRGRKRIEQFLSPSYNDGRSIGERAARTLEYEVGLPFGWLDRAGGAIDAGIPVSPAAHDQRQLAAQREATDAAMRASFQGQASAPRDNPVHRALFSLPPIQASACTDVAVPELPVQKVVTGDAEIDAVLWLREVIRTGQADLIAKAKEAAARIKTPLDVLEKRYRDHLARAHPGNWVAALSSFGFADLESLSANSIERAARRLEAHARFGDKIFEDTPAEQFCHETLKGLRIRKGEFTLDEAKVDARFDAQLEQRPGTLSDCIFELSQWRQLCWLRSAVGNYGDTSEQVYARENYVFRLMARIRPRNVEEAAEVFRYIKRNDDMGRDYTDAIILNLIGAPEPYPAKKGGK